MYPSLLVLPSPSPSPLESTYLSAGLKKTKGTIFLLPPTVSTLRATYTAPPRPKTRMSSGAVALCKHFERGGASSELGRAHPFWRLPFGSNEKKTAIADEILEEMLGDAAWRNVMLLHAAVAVYEVRNSLGYGMRWTLNVEEVELDEEDRSTEEENTGENAAQLPEHQESYRDDAEKEWKIKKTTFRGLLEPIEGLDHELPR